MPDPPLAVTPRHGLLLAALVCFLVSTVVSVPRINLTALGLALVTLAQLV